MAEAPKNIYKYRVLRCTPTIIWDKWVNISACCGKSLTPMVLAALLVEFDLRLRASPAETTRCNSARKGRFSPATSTPNSTWREHTILDHTADVFLRRRVPKLKRNVGVDKFTEPGDSLKLDYGYQNGVRGYLHAVVLGHDPSQPKILDYTVAHPGTPAGMRVHDRSRRPTGERGPAAPVHHAPFRGRKYRTGSAITHRALCRRPAPSPAGKSLTLLAGELAPLWQSAKA